MIFPRKGPTYQPNMNQSKIRKSNTIGCIIAPSKARLVPAGESRACALRAPRTACGLLGPALESLCRWAASLFSSTVSRLQKMIVWRNGTEVLNMLPGFT